ncbi:NAD(P)/FAD-dependent oxidoreductase [Amycolatopsis australiensis]|uniref:3-phenylpropionate/trans-cinnamate dioxygenase ferredoxin reductase subunit n=1 Tax=Amycolatopsis australiensis TaxID=546364 RepID=A0A1K1SHN1_9PSEU|nr:FAD-dependent oxidoreductase [Amycolatopsis australiensis]SFW83904.1 3-phenylpropionate/trans-cinnamate dioxygenase ferredoxin reductase subunit [Amycolatopsis australiensis]
MDTHVVAGGGLTAAKAAETLRAEGFAGRIVIVGAEPDLPYERPPLSKGYLLGQDDRASVFVHDEKWYADQGIEVLTGRRVTALDRAAHEVELDGGERLGYTKLLLATGASPRRLRVPGNDLDGVHYLRRLSHADRLREALRAGGRVVVAGAGWIGLETAAAARTYGCEVTIVEPAPSPLHATLGPELGGFFAGLHRRHGVELRLGTGVTGFAGDTTVTAVRTDTGEIPADVVIVGIGARPETQLAEEAGLAVDDGVCVDAALRTEDPDIFAAGDVASVWNPAYGRRIRVEHWAAATNGGPAAARSMLGREPAYDDLPYFFSDQYDAGMEFTGWFPPGGYDRVVTRGGDEAFHAFWLAGDRVVAGLHVNQWDEGLDAVRELIRSGRPVDAAALADPARPLPS